MWPKTERKRVVRATKFKSCLRLSSVASRPLRFRSSSGKAGHLLDTYSHSLLVDASQIQLRIGIHRNWSKKIIYISKTGKFRH
jgi:hypothetical protein